MVGADKLEQGTVGFRSGQTVAPKSSQVTIFCDLDGPLIDVSQRYYQTYQLGRADTQAWFQDQGITLPLQILTKDQFWQLKQARTPDVEIAQRSGLEGEQIDFFLQRVGQLVNQPALLEKDQLQPGVRWALARLHACGFRLAVITLRCQTQAIALLQKYQLDHLFTEVCGTQDQQAAYHNYTDVKTNLLHQVLAKYPLAEAESAWMIGDTEADVQAGQASGLSTIALTCGIRSCTYLYQLQPTRIHSNLLSASHFLLGLEPSEH